MGWGHRCGRNMGHILSHGAAGVDAVESVLEGVDEDDVDGGLQGVTHHVRPTWSQPCTRGPQQLTCENIHSQSGCVAFTGPNPHIFFLFKAHSHFMTLVVV